MIAALLLLQVASPPPPIIDWQPFPIQRTPDGGLYDRTTARRRGDVVTVWVRLLNISLKGVNGPRQQADTHMEIDCGKPRMRMIEMRIVNPDGTVRQAVPGDANDLRWHPMRVGMRGYDIWAGLCSRVRGR